MYAQAQQSAQPALQVLFFLMRSVMRDALSMDITQTLSIMFVSVKNYYHTLSQYLIIFSSLP